jgi:hypothetical protein
LETSFIRQWGEKKYHIYYLTEFKALRKKTFESILEFIQIFNKLYHKIPVEDKPSQPAAKVTFVRAFDSDFALLLREQRSTTLVGMQYDAIEIESNMTTSRKLKTKFEMGTREPRHFKEHVGPSGSGKNAEEKMDEILKIIKDLSNKISKMEMEQAKPDPYVQNQLRRNPNPQIQQRKIKNEEQKIQAPFKIENFIQRDEVKDYDELDEYLNNLNDDDLETHLTKQDYEKSLDLESLFNDDGNINNLRDSTYKGLTDSIMAELQHKYDLRPREKMQAAQINKVEMKEILAKNTENKEAEVQTEEIEKSIGTFNLGNELNKTNILIPLVELARNPIYKKQIAKEIHFSDVECQDDAINL